MKYKQTRESIKWRVGSLKSNQQNWEAFSQINNERVHINKVELRGKPIQQTLKKLKE